MKIVRQIFITAKDDINMQKEIRKRENLFSSKEKLHH